MTARLLALDLDGTLLRRDGTIADQDLEAIAWVRQKGVEVTIATGRMFAGTRGAAQLAGITGPVVCVDGSSMVEAGSGQVLFERHLDVDVVSQMAAQAAEHQLAAFQFCDDAIFHNDEGVPFVKYVATWSPVLRHGSQRGLSNSANLAALLIGHRDRIATVHGSLAPVTDLTSLFRVQFDISHPAADGAAQSALLVRAAGTSKGTGLTALCQYHGIDVADAVVVGDWLNDVPMFKVAGRSFAMGGAIAEVSAAATDQLQSPHGQGGGVAELIARVWR